MRQVIWQWLSVVCLVLGLASILASIGVWTLYEPADPAHAQRLAIFVGLWAPTFLILSERLAKSSLPDRLLSPNTVPARV